MRKKLFISLEDRIKENIRTIKEDQQLMDRIESRIDQRHHERLKQIPS